MAGSHAAALMTIGNVTLTVIKPLNAYASALMIAATRLMPSTRVNAYMAHAAIASCNATKIPYARSSGKT